MRRRFDAAYDAAMEKIAESRIVVTLPQGYLPESHRVEPEIESELWKRLAKHMTETGGRGKSEPRRSGGKVVPMGIYYHDDKLRWDQYPEGSPFREALRKAGR